MRLQLSKNLDILMSESHLNAEELSRQTGLPASTIKKIRNNNEANPTLSTLAPIAKYFSLTISQLIGDETFPRSRIKGSYKVNPEKLNYIPVISWKEAITWPNRKANNYSTLATERIYSKNAYSLLVEEDNWENLTKGTALVIDPDIEAEHRDFVIIHKNGQKIPIAKQILFDEEQRYLKPLTLGYNIAAFTPDHKILGVIVEYKKHLKNFKCNLGDCS